MAWPGRASWRWVGRGIAWGRACAGASSRWAGWWRPGAVALGLVPVSVVALLGGCNIVAPAYVLLAGPPKVPAEHTLDRDRPVAVVLDDPDSIVPSLGYRRVMLETAQERLAERARVREVIDSRDTQAVLSRDRAQERLSLVEIGRAIGAEQVVWARVEGFSLAASTGEYRPNARLRVKVVDVSANRRAWPTDAPEGYVLEVVMPVRSDYTPTSGPQQRAAMEDLARYAGRALAELFYSEEKTLSARAGG